MRRRRLRVLLVALVLLGAINLAVSLALLLGDYPLSPAQALAALYGVSDDRLATFFVQQLRAPRVLLTLLVGVLLAGAGHIFQQLTGNPLGSPDITGVTVGSATGALIMILLFGASPAGISLGALAGGLATGALTFALCNTTELSGGRFVLVGIGIAAMAQGLNSLLVVRASLTSAQTAALWLTGSFNATQWDRVAVIGLATAILVPLALLAGRALPVMTLGKELASGLGVAVRRHTIWLLLLAVTMVAVAVAAAGPISFVALAAPHLARGLARRPSLVCSALFGALLVLVSDIIAQRIFAPTQIPVGIVTGVLGGLYLVLLIARRKTHG